MFAKYALAIKNFIIFRDRGSILAVFQFLEKVSVSIFLVSRKQMITKGISEVNSELHVI